MHSYWNKKTFCLVTGASRGIGRCIAEEVSKVVSPGSVILAIARTAEALSAVKAEISSTSKGVTVVAIPCDLGIPDYSAFKAVIQSALDQSGQKAANFAHAILFQNAASLGIQHGLKVAEISDLTEIQNYYAFNLNSFILLNTAFFSIFNTPSQLKTVVHISSGGVIEPFKTWGLYCAAKSARNMLLKSMALESGIEALNYAPGSVNTAIYDEAVKFTADSELAKAFEEDRKAGKVLTCEQTVTKLLRILSTQQFTKGEHVSYHDIQ